MAEKKDPKLNIDGIEYRLNDLSDNAKAQFRSLQMAEAEIKQLNVRVALMQTARNAYLQALQTELPKQANGAD